MKTRDIWYRLDELEIALRAIEIDIEGLMKTKDKAYLLSLKSTLRTLIALGGANKKPLLIELSDETGIPLEFFSDRPKELSSIEPNTVASSIAGKSWHVYPKEGLNIYTLQEWLSIPAYLISNTGAYTTRNKILNQIDNDESVIHFDKNVKVIVDKLQNLKNSKFNGVEFFLIDMCLLVSWFGRRLILLNNNSDDEKIKENDDFFEGLHI